MHHKQRPIITKHGHSFGGRGSSYIPATPPAPMPLAQAQPDPALYEPPPPAGVNTRDHPGVGRGDARQVVEHTHAISRGRADPWARSDLAISLIASSWHQFEQLFSLLKPVHWV